MMQLQSSPAQLVPSILRVLVVDSKPSSQSSAVQLLRECHYQVRCDVRVICVSSTALLKFRLQTCHYRFDITAVCSEQVFAVQTSKAALQLLAGPSAMPFDIVLKEHDPPKANACRLLRRMARCDLLSKIPVIGEFWPVILSAFDDRYFVKCWVDLHLSCTFTVTSALDDREEVMKCLTFGAIDYLIKPLRHNELRHVWTRVWWWRKVSDCQHAFTPSSTALFFRQI